MTVTATEFHFKLSKPSVPHGSITFTVVNKGQLGHDFKIGGKKTPVIKPGKSAKLTVTLKTGKVAYLCTVPGHAAAGMKGKPPSSSTTLEPRRRARRAAPAPLLLLCATFPRARGDSCRFADDDWCTKSSPRGGTPDPSRERG